MNQNPKFHILLNPVAGNGNSIRSFQQLKKYLKRKNYSFSYETSKYSGHLFSLAKDFANHNLDKRILITIGGDGSLNEVVNGIKSSKNSDLPIAYLPSGSGNDFARAANLTDDPIKFINHLIKSPKTMIIDCGYYESPDLPKNYQYFVNNVGIGFDAYVVHLSNNENLKAKLNKFHLGNLIYPINIINVLKKQDTFSVTVECNHQIHHYDDVYFATTTNHPYFGGGIAILPRANLYSKVLDIVIVEKPNLLKFIRLFIKLLKNGSHTSDPHFHYFEGKNIALTTEKKEFAQIDGEDQPKRNYSIKFSTQNFKLIK